jgi:hypothetical protein
MAATQGNDAEEQTPIPPDPSAAHLNVAAMQLAAKAAFNPALWSTCATVIPVLIIALVFQERAFEPADDESLDHSFFLIGMAIAMAWGEGVALIALAQTKTPGLPAKIVVGAGIEFPLLVLAVRMTHPRFDALEQTLSPLAFARIKGGLVLLVVAFTVATFAGAPTGEWPSIVACAVVLGALLWPVRARRATTQHRE